MKIEVNILVTCLKIYYFCDHERMKKAVKSIFCTIWVIIRSVFSKEWVIIMTKPRSVFLFWDVVSLRMINQKMVKTQYNELKLYVFADFVSLIIIHLGAFV